MRHTQGRPLVPECARCPMAHPDFGRSVSTRGTNYAHLITTGTPGFSDLPTALLYCPISSVWPPCLPPNWRRHLWILIIGANLTYWSSIELERIGTSHRSSKNSSCYIHIWHITWPNVLIIHSSNILKIAIPVKQNWVMLRIGAVGKQILKAIHFVNSVCTIFSLWKQDPPHQTFPS